MGNLTKFGGFPKVLMQASDFEFAEDSLSRRAAVKGWTTIYAVGAAEGGPVKFGKTSSIDDRIKELQIGSPIKLSVLATIFAHTGLEPAIHAFLGKHRVRGEWFSRSDPTIRVIEFMQYSDLPGLISYMEQAIEEKAKPRLLLSLRKP